jgi:hypothetical protein
MSGGGAPNQEDVMPSSSLRAILRSLSAPSRRGLFSLLMGGLLIAGAQALTGDEAAARNRRKRRKRRKKRTNQKARIRVTATCPGSDRFGFGANDGNVRVAQTFTASASGRLVKVQLSSGKEEGSLGDYVLRLSLVDDAGVPTNDVLAEAVLANASVPEGDSIITFTFGSPVSVAAGTEYALVLTRPGGGNINLGVEPDDPCDGQTFFSSDQTAPFEPNLGDDLTFTAFVRS